jgi:hypothetical protein
MEHHCYFDVANVVFMSVSKSSLLWIPFWNCQCQYANSFKSLPKSHHRTKMLCIRFYQRGSEIWWLMIEFSSLSFMSYLNPHFVTTFEEQISWDHPRELILRAAGNRLLGPRAVRKPAISLAFFPVQSAVDKTVDRDCKCQEHYITFKQNRCLSYMVFFFIYIVFLTLMLLHKWIK